MRSKGLSDKEAALLAAARRELAKKPSAAPHAASGPVAPVPPANKPEFAAPPPPKPDISTRMAMLLDAERHASEDRKRRIKRNYMILVAAVMVPAFLYALVTMFRLLAR